MQTHRRFRPYDRKQLLLLPPNVQDWVAPDDLARFICSVVDQLDLQSFYSAYDSDGGGRPPYDPRLMVSLLLYGYCIGVRSSRKLEAAI
jgi:transposase